MDKFDYLHEHVENLLDMEDELRITQDYIENQDAYGRVETQYEKAHALAEELYRQEFLSYVIRHLDDIYMLLNEFEYREYRHGVSGYMINIKTPKLASLDCFYSIQDQFCQDMIYEFERNLEMDWELKWTGKSGGWLCVLPNEVFNRKLPITDEITTSFVLDVQKDDFIRVENFIYYHHMQDVINELQSFKTELRLLLDFKKTVKRRIEKDREYFLTK